MRITNDEIKIIKSAILEVLKNAKIYLFGSRLYDDKKGGDIDVFVESTEDITLKEKVSILAQIDILGIKRKVDLIIKTPSSKEQPIFKTAIKEGVLL